MPLPLDFVSELRRHFSGDIRLDLASRILYSTDASIYQIEPLGVVLPRTQDDLQASVELAAKYRVPILPRGSGTSLAGQAIGEALILDCSRWLDKILEIDPQARLATVEPGVILADLNRAAAKYGLQFGPDPASAERATIGGVISNNATGAHSIQHGMTADHLISADVIFSDGRTARLGEERIENMLLHRWDSSVLLSPLYSSVLDIREKYAAAIEEHYPKTWRNSAGYRLNYLLPWSPSTPSQWERQRDRSAVYDDIPNRTTINLASLLAGSEGTLAVIRRATLNLISKPTNTVLGILTFQSNADACDAVPRLLEFRPSAIELIPRMILNLARRIPAYASQMEWVAGDPAALLVVEFSGLDAGALREAVRRLDPDVVVIESVEEQESVWNVRRAGLGILDARPQSARPATFMEDCAIPVEHLGDFVREVERIFVEYHTEAGIYAHASAGCLHIRPILDLKSPEGVHSLREIAEHVLTLTLRLGGSMASEHGDGIARGEWLKQTYGQDLVVAMRSMKRAVDPQGLLNPGKMFDAPPMDSYLRYGSGYQARAWVPAMDFSRNGSLATAVEQCNGQGVCRKAAGVMCPSFQASRDEMHSTRGRANLLRALISQPRLAGTGSSAVDDLHSDIGEAVFRALDLCLACKGCKAECPSGVDMAKLKFAFLAEYFKTHPRPLRDYLFGYFHVTARILSAIAPIANLSTALPGVTRLAAGLAHITHHRPFPKFVRRPARITPAPGCPRVILLADPFTRYVETRVEQSAFNVLSAAGFDVQVVPTVGAGASLISKGFFDAARRHARQVLADLNRLDPEGALPVIGVEPSELYAFKHDYLDLLPDQKPEIERHSVSAWLLEEFMIRSGVIARLRIATLTRHILLHPHCHQKAEALAEDGQPNGTNASLAFLRGCGFKVDLIEAGCCGMAGTFGYEAEHYQLSQQVGELRLFPRVRESGGALIAATGAACRMQIAQGTGVSAEHPVVYADWAIQESRQATA